MNSPRPFASFDFQMMDLALCLARKGMNTTTPNPRVGCVIVDNDGQLLAQAYHQRAGEPHAEILALQQAGASARGARVYVTLEPCNHQGRTGPCSQALIAAGVGEVIFGMTDPNPLVAGEGLQSLRAAGISVRGPLLEESCRELNPGFIKRMESGLPFVRVKMAMSVDGRTAMASGESKWITSPPARDDVQRWRARSCAIVTGVNTVLHDDPALTVRNNESDRQPMRVIADTHARSLPSAAIFKQPGETVVASCVSWPHERAENWLLPKRAEQLDLRALLGKLAERGCNEVLVESGAGLAGAFVREALVDELIIYIAPKLMGSDARPLFELPISTMNGILPLKIKDIRAFGCDWRILADVDPDS